MHTHTHPFYGPFSRTTQVSRYQRGETNLDCTEARDSEWQWHQLGHMQVRTSLQTDNHASTSPLSFLQAGCPSCRPKHWRQRRYINGRNRVVDSAHNLTTSVERHAGPQLPVLYKTHQICRAGLPVVHHDPSLDRCCSAWCRQPRQLHSALCVHKQHTGKTHWPISSAFVTVQSSGVVISISKHTRALNGPLSRTTRISRYQKGKTNLFFLLKLETVSGSGISWAICKSAPHSKQMTTPALHHSVVYRPDALPAAQPTASRHWRQKYCQI